MAFAQDEWEARKARYHVTCDTCGNQMQAGSLFAGRGLQSHVERKCVACFGDVAFAPLVEAREREMA